MESTASYKGLAASILKGSFRTLRELVFCTMMPEKNANLNDPFHGSIEELGKLAGEMKCLEYVCMDFKHHSTDVDEVLYELCDIIQTKCEVLDRIFADHEAFPSLGCISINITFSVYMLDHPDSETRMEEQLETAANEIKQQSFPNLQASPTINFNFNLDMRWIVDSL
jgi:hypothetical protein